MEIPKRPCFACGKEGAPVKCPCNEPSYCGKECQLDCWEDHKKRCTVFMSAQLTKTCSLHGKDTIQVGEASLHLGMTLASQGRNKAAEKNLREGVRIYCIFDGYKGPNVAHALHQLGKVYCRKGWYVDARKAVRDALDMIKRSGGNRKNVDTADALVSMGQICLGENKAEEAEERFNTALEIYVFEYGGMHERVASAMAHLGTVYAKMGTPARAMAKFKVIY